MYNDIIIENFTNPKNTQPINNSDFVINTGNPVCDDQIAISVKISENIIQETSQKAYGCATSLATSSIFSEYIKGKPLDYFLQETEKKSVTEKAKSLLGILEPSQMHCYDIFEELFNNLLEKIES